MEVIYTANPQPDIVLGGIRLGEPVIALTGMLVALASLYCVRMLRRAGDAHSVRMGRVFFVLTGVSCALGSLFGHVFLYALPFTWKLPGWIVGMVGVSALQQVALLRYRDIHGPFAGRGLFYANIALLVVGLWLVSTTLWFPVVEIHAATGFLGMVLPLEWYRLGKLPNGGSQFMLKGICALVVAVIFHILKWSLGPWFCYFDIGHVFMAVALYFFATGISRGVGEYASY
jgi:hypothetical protein